MPRRFNCLYECDCKNECLMSHEEPIEKTCTGCHTPKPLSEFYKHPAGAHGVGSRCKECMKRYDTYYRIENADKVSRRKKKKYCNGGKEKEKIKNKKHRELLYPCYVKKILRLEGVAKSEITDALIIRRRETIKANRKKRAARKAKSKTTRTQKRMPAKERERLIAVIKKIKEQK